MATLPDTHIDLSRLMRLDRKPRLFFDSGLSFWTDPYISRHVLNAHLDPTTDDASRPPAVIRATVNWICNRAKDLLGPDFGRGDGNVLDIACGPGLYCVEFARRGFVVHGWDSSLSSITYAKREAHRQRLAIAYECADYRTLSARGQFDVATLIYGEFSVMSDKDRNKMLRKVYRALRPGGLFVFDVFTESYAARTALKTRWYVSRGDGFWAKEPHLVLERGLWYRDQDVHLNRYLVMIQNDDCIREYNIWRHYYSSEAISRVLETSGFEVCGLFGDLTGLPLEGSMEWIGVLARRPA